MIYYAKIKKQKENKYLVEFPDLKECLTERDTFFEALDGWLASNCDRKLAIPDPKIRKSKNYHAIEVSLYVAFSIILRKARKKKNLSQAQVAKFMGISQQAYAKLEMPHKTNPSLTTIQKLSEALNINFEMNLAS